MLDIRSSEPMPTRPCEYSFAMQDDCVFADFNLNSEECFYLVRISFDGYGCCYPSPDGKIGTMNKRDSDNLVDSIQRGGLDQPEVHNIMLSYFLENSEYLWVDALKSHNLL